MPTRVTGIAWPADYPGQLPPMEPHATSVSSRPAPGSHLPDITRTGASKFTESQRLPDVSYEGFARSLGLHGIAVDKPGDVGPAWDQALAADRPTVLDLRTDPDVPPIPPHATYEQMKDAATAMLKGDPDRWGVLKEGVKTKVQEFLPGKGN